MTPSKLFVQPTATAFIVVDAVPFMITVRADRSLVIYPAVDAEIEAHVINAALLAEVVVG